MKHSALFPALLLAAGLVLAPSPAYGQGTMAFNPANGKVVVPTNFWPANIQELTNALNSAGYAPGSGEGATALSGLSDVLLSTLAAGDLLTFDFIAGKWTNRVTTTAGWALMQAANAATQRTALGLGTAATNAASAFEPAGVAAADISDGTAAGRTLLTAADAAAQRTALGLGTAATNAASAFEPSGVAAADITDGTAAGRALLTAATAAAQRTALGLGTAATNAASAFEPAGVAAADISDGTAAGRTLLTAADAAAQRTALGLGTAATNPATAFEPAGVAAADITDGTAAGRALLTAATAGAQRTALGLAEASTNAVNKAGDTMTGALQLPANAYDASTWNGSLKAATEDAIRDKIESLSFSGGGVSNLTQLLDFSTNASQAQGHPLVFLGGGKYGPTNAMVLDTVSVSNLTASNFASGSLGLTGTNILYVSTRGNDATAVLGSSIKPWRTVRAACSNAVSGQVVYVQAGIYDETVGTNLSIFVKSGVTLAGDGMGVSRIVWTPAVSLAVGNFCVIEPEAGAATNVVRLRDLSIEITRTNVYAAPFGAFGDSGTPQYPEIIVDNVEFVGWTDAIYFQYCTARATFNSCVFSSAWDMVYLYAATDATFNNCKFTFAPNKTWSGLSSSTAGQIGGSSVALFKDSTFFFDPSTNNPSVTNNQWAGFMMLTTGKVTFDSCRRVDLSYDATNAIPFLASMGSGSPSVIPVALRGKNDIDFQEYAALQPDLNGPPRLICETPQWLKYRFTATRGNGIGYYWNFTAAATSQTYDLFTLPPGAIVEEAYVYKKTAVGTVSTATIELGTSGTTTKYLPAVDVKTTGSSSLIKLGYSETAGDPYNQADAGTIIRAVLRTTGGNVSTIATGEFYLFVKVSSPGTAGNPGAPTYARTLSGDGSGLTNLNAGYVASGTLAAARLPVTNSVSFAGIISDETGSGGVVLSNAPSINNPTFLGVASATTVSTVTNNVGTLNVTNTATFQSLVVVTQTVGTLIATNSSLASPTITGNPVQELTAWTAYSSVTNFVVDASKRLLTLTMTNNFAILHATNRPGTTTTFKETGLRITGGSTNWWLLFPTGWKQIGTNATLIKSNVVTWVAITTFTNETDTAYAIAP